MRSWVLAACLLAAAAVPPAQAADMDDGSSLPNGYYDDDDRRTPPWAPRHRDDDDDDGDDDDDDGRYRPHGKNRHSGVQPPYGKTCARGEEVRDRLSSRGWRDFHAGREGGEVVTLRARHPNGRLFELTLLRCSGQLVDARPLEPRPFGPYAFKGPREQYGPPGRWDRDGYASPGFERPYAYRWPRRWYPED